jgi:hypothetical protein
MLPIMLNRMRGVSWGCVDLLFRVCLLVLPGFVLAVLAAILGALVLLDGSFLPERLAAR